MLGSLEKAPQTKYRSRDHPLEPSKEREGSHPSKNGRWLGPKNNAIHWILCVFSEQRWEERIKCQITHLIVF
jgi:hypothetical protein